MKNREKMYWAAQLSGWGLFIAGNFLVYSAKDSIPTELIAGWAMVFILGIFISHSWRQAIKRLGWNSLSVGPLIPVVFFSALAMGFLETLSFGGLDDLIFSKSPPILNFRSVEFYVTVGNFSVVFLLWLILYFAFQFFEKYREEGTKNIRLHAAQTESELSSLRNQINPHFLFNSLNSIRALVDENPAKAKEAVTLLSSILRATLYAGRRESYVLSEEVLLVENYVRLEKIRFEERLLFQAEVNPGLGSVPIPPLLILTLVENAVKHGISSLKRGGMVRLKIDELPENRVSIEVWNNGTLTPKKSSDGGGIGLENTRKRISLLYGNRADFEIKQSGDYVVARVEIPKITAI
jgi:two-component system, LytTR family, sensor kinase